MASVNPVVSRRPFHGNKTEQQNSIPFHGNKEQNNRIPFHSMEIKQKKRNNHCNWICNCLCSVEDWPYLIVITSINNTIENALKCFPTKGGWSRSLWQAMQDHWIWKKDVWCQLQLPMLDLFYNFHLDNFIFRDLDVDKQTKLLLNILFLSCTVLKSVILQNQLRPTSRKRYSCLLLQQTMKNIRQDKRCLTKTLRESFLKQNAF